MTREICGVILFVAVWVVLAFSWSHNASINAAEQVNEGWHQTSWEVR